jgi:hypothetical protein
MRVILLILLIFFISPAHSCASTKDPFDALLLRGARHIIRWHECPEAVQAHFINEHVASKEFYLLPAQSFAHTIDTWSKNKRDTPYALSRSLTDHTKYSGTAFTLTSLPHNKKNGFYVKKIWDLLQKSPYGISISKTLPDDPYKELLYIGCLLKASYDDRFKDSTQLINLFDVIGNIFTQIRTAPFEVRAVIIDTAKSLMDTPHDLQSVGSESITKVCSRRGSDFSIDTAPALEGTEDKAGAGKAGAEKEKGEKQPVIADASPPTPSRMGRKIVALGVIGVAAFVLLNPEATGRAFRTLRDWFRG